MKIVDQKNFFTAIFYLLFGLTFAWGSTYYKIGTSTRMGPGFFPLMVAIGLAATGFVLLLSSIRTHADETKLDDWSFRTVGFVLLTIVLFGLLIEPGGLIIAVPVLLIGAALSYPPVSMRDLALSIAVLLPMTWLIFVALLGLQITLLPKFLYE